MSKIIERSMEEGVRVSTVIDDLPLWMQVSTDSSPSHLAVCTDGITLAVCVHKKGHPFVEIFEIKSLANKVCIQWFNCLVPTHKEHH